MRTRRGRRSAALTLVAGLALFVWGAASVQAALPGRNGRIAYEDQRTSGPIWIGPSTTDSQILSILPDGSRPRTLLGFDRGGFAEPAYSPDGRKLAIASGGETTGSSLYLVRADGRGRVRRLTRLREQQYDLSPGWAPDGRRLVYKRSSPHGSEVRVYRAGRSRRIASGEVAQPVWSAQGRIAFSSGRLIYTMRPDGSQRRRVVAGYNPDWSPHGNWIVYELPSAPGTGVPGGGGGGIAMIRPRDRRRHVLTTDSAGAPAFSPSGKEIVFQRYDRTTGRQAIAVMRLRDRRTRTIAAAPLARSPTPQSYEAHSFLAPTWQPLPRRRHR